MQSLHRFDMPLTQAGGLAMQSIQDTKAHLTLDVQTFLNKEGIA